MKTSNQPGSAKITNLQALEGGSGSQLNRLMEEAQVKNYLVNNPDFLAKNPQLLGHIELNHGFDQTTSLVERQIKVLRDRNQVMQGQLVEMLQAAHSNEQLLIQCNHFMLTLLQAESFAILTTQIIDMLKQDFDLDDAALVLVGEYPQNDNIKRVADAAEIKSVLNCQFPDSEPLCGRLELNAKTTLFGEKAEVLQSFALIPLGNECEKGLLALASQDVARFDPDMGTLFIELIAKLVAHLTSRYEINQG
ncbi:DUF484 family protein [Aliikangiella marina]|uniref:DUF484 family protein n=1 Tax=Aliikangiella marina TaxID=1712262 RepID=A0A545T4D5_9GAMM|nr:DUF484 family protein [Aliikangiella marina]TQV72002.1 DUF484 family protein [Aliikangiella marina]TQV72055.1 DUF484 family protein [Aliikangiella marina]